MAKSITLMALAISFTMVIELATAANYTVGDSAGWEIGTDYTSWLSNKKFFVGDILNFEYSPNHNVVEVLEPDFSACEEKDPIRTYIDSVTTITLSSAGKRYFLCGISGHCRLGMKIQIDVLQSSSSPPPTPSTDTPPPATPPPSSAPPAKPPAKTPSAPPPGFVVSPPAPPPEPSTPTPTPTPAPDSPTPPFPFDMPLNPTGGPTTPMKPPPPPSSAYRYGFRVDLSVGFSFVVMMLFLLL